jgi:hypothetical protein
MTSLADTKAYYYAVNSLIRKQGLVLKQMISNNYTKNSITTEEHLLKEADYYNLYRTFLNNPDDNKYSQAEEDFFERMVDVELSRSRRLRQLELEMPFQRWDDGLRVAAPNDYVEAEFLKLIKRTTR